MRFFKTLFLAVLLNQSFGTEGSGRADELLGVFYFSKIFGHIHQFPSPYSSALTTISCNHPIKVYKTTNSKEGWRLVKTVGLQGYIQSEYLASKQVQCFQSQYSKFFDALDLSVSDMYYWGRLSDLYIKGKSKVGR